MANVEITWTVSGKSHADIVLGYDPNAVDANGNVTVTSASGTYQVLDGSNNVVRTDQVTGLIAPNSFSFAPDDKVNVLGKNPIVDTSGLGVLIDNASDADQIGPNNTPEVELSTDIFGDYRELQKGDATNVTLQQVGSTTPPSNPSGGSGGSGGGTTSSGATTTTSGGVTTTTFPGGNHRVDIDAPGQTVTSNFFDVFHNHASPETTFVFNPGYGRDTIGLFRVEGSDHDILSFKGSDFGDSIAEVLQNARQVKGGVLITDPTPSSPGPGGNDTLLLLGIGKGELVRNQADITFHT